MLSLATPQVGASERDAAVMLALADARATAEEHEAKRADIEADIARRQTQLAIEAIETTPAPRRARAPSPEPDREQRRAAAVPIEADREADREAMREFMVEVVGMALGQQARVLHERIDALETDLLAARGLLHENGLAIKGMLPDPADDLAPRLPRVRVRAGSRKVTDRMPNRVGSPRDDTTPWFNLDAP